MGLDKAKGYLLKPNVEKRSRIGPNPAPTLNPILGPQLGPMGPMWGPISGPSQKNIFESAP